MSKDRIFTSIDVDGKEAKLKFIQPSQKLVSQGDFVYREHFGKSVRAGLLTNAEATKLLKDRNVWGDDREREAIEMQAKITELEDQLETMGHTDDGLRVYGELKRLRADLVDLGNIRKTIIENTAESVATEMRTQFYAAECVVYNSSGRRVFKGLKEFHERLGDNLTLDCYRQALIYNYETVFGIDLSDQSLDSRNVEDKWFDELRPEKEEEKDTQDKDVEQAEEVVEKPKKKRRTRKKKAPATQK